MTSQREQLQGLIAEIEVMLGKASPKLPWVVSNETAQQRRVLEKVYEYLQTLEHSSGLTTGELTADGELRVGEVAEGSESLEASAGTVLQALLQEMQYLRSQMVQPLRSEISDLQQERQALLEEVRQIELTRQQMQLPAPALDQANLDQLFQALAERLEGQMRYQIEQSVQRLDAEVTNTQLLSEAAQPAPDLGEQLPQLSPAQRLEQMKQLQRQSDELVLNLDKTLRAVFEALQQSVYSYQDSLSQGLDKMHTLGQQGEMMFNAMIAHLAQQMSQDGPAYLEAARDRGDQPAQLPVARQTAATPPAAGETPSVDEDWDALEALNLDLDFEEDEEVTLFQLDEELTQLQLDEPEESPFAIGADPEDVTVIQTGPNVEESKNEDLTDPLRLLDQLDEAAPDPEARVEVPPGETLPAASVKPISGAEDPYQELDELYETLFGEDSISLAAPAEASPGTEPRTDADLNLMSWEPEGTETDAYAESFPDLMGSGSPRDDLTANDLTGDDPVEDQPLVEGFTVDEFAVSEPSADEFALEGLTDGESPINESLADDFTVGEPFVNEFAVGESSADDLTVGEPVGQQFDISSSSSFEDEPTLDTLLFDEAVDQVPEPSAAETFDLADPTEPDVPAISGESAATLDEVFGADFSQSLMAEVEEETIVAETISSLAQLLPDEPGTFQPRSPDSLDETGFGREEYGAAEDTFIPAAADEDLLATDDLEVASGFGLEFGETTLEQLNADLSQLELQEDLAPATQDWSEPSPEPADLELFPEASPESSSVEPQNVLPQEFWLTAPASPELETNPTASLEDSAQTVDDGFTSDSEVPSPEEDATFLLDQLFAIPDQEGAVEPAVDVQPSVPAAEEEADPAFDWQTLSDQEGAPVADVQSNVPSAEVVPVNDLQSLFDQEGTASVAADQPYAPTVAEEPDPADDLQSIVQELGLASAADPSAVGESGLTLEDLLEATELEATELEASEPEATELEEPSTAEVLPLVLDEPTPEPLSADLFSDLPAETLPSPSAESLETEAALNLEDFIDDLSLGDAPQPEAPIQEEAPTQELVTAESLFEEVAELPSAEFREPAATVDDDDLSLDLLESLDLSLGSATDASTFDLTASEPAEDFTLDALGEDIAVEPSPFPVLEPEPEPEGAAIAPEGQPLPLAPSSDDDLSDLLDNVASLLEARGTLSLDPVMPPEPAAPTAPEPVEQSAEQQPEETLAGLADDWQPAGTEVTPAEAEFAVSLEDLDLFGDEPTMLPSAADEGEPTAGEPALDSAELGTPQDGWGDDPMAFLETRAESNDDAPAAAAPSEVIDWDDLATLLESESAAAGLEGEPVLEESASFLEDATLLGDLGDLNAALDQALTTPFPQDEADQGLFGDLLAPPETAADNLALFDDDELSLPVTETASVDDWLAEAPPAEAFVAPEPSGEALSLADLLRLVAPDQEQLPLDLEADEAAETMEVSSQQRMMADQEDLPIEASAAEIQSLSVLTTPDLSLELLGLLDSDEELLAELTSPATVEPPFLPEADSPTEGLLTGPSPTEIEAPADRLTAPTEADLISREIPLPDVALEITEAGAVVPETAGEVAAPVDSGTAALVPESGSDLGGVREAWFLGLDIGTTGLSAVLLNQIAGQVYPLYWVDNTVSGVTADKFFRLPTIASLAVARTGQDSWRLQSVGSSALTVTWDDEDRFDDGENDSVSLLLKNLKPLLKLGISYREGDTGQEAPQVQWSETVQVPLQSVQASLQALLATLCSGDQNSLSVGAVGLEEAAITHALGHLQGVIASYPANWPDTYSFNLREAILAAGLAQSADQIYFIEDAIAAVLSGLPNPATPVQTASTQPLRQQTLYACNWSGGTVVISAGATLTELGVVNLPRPLSRLAYQDFGLHSLAYAGDGIDLDIIAYLLHPADRRQSQAGQGNGEAASTETGWGWQASPDLGQANWAALNLDELEMPRIAEPDPALRYRLQQRLESSLLGQSVLEAARHLKLILQHQNQFELKLADQRWMVRRKDLENRIVLPYIQRINGHLNRLMSQSGQSAQSVNQVICTGGTASLPSITRWLRQKFPNATIIQDTYPNNRPPSCSRVAYGLVNLVRYPQVLDLIRHQYSDNFLLMELVRTFPDQPLPLTGILHLLEQRGVNTQACELHLIALLEGRLPPGLVPSVNDVPPLSASSLEEETVRSLNQAPLFTRQNGQIYVPNTDQCQQLLAYLAAVLAGKYQQLEEPLFVQLGQPAL
ncbi:hypothetical protein [Pseudanabaena sp. FACHB-2040]|uniref:hypothetical protein n=1 Tax=Pseudanabaena sp. FACHB-2040 TaxID=2692859 RepID=UPI001685E4E4|nr:hypothetical protein [Pseudanabaena sp. FACHB-2040]MBD2260124.1 hypothetical protein [Pseudanabaena sp. FACHB-2040]